MQQRFLLLQQPGDGLGRDVPVGAGGKRQLMLDRELTDHVLDGQQGQDFVLAEPKARQLRALTGFVEFVAAQVTVKDDGHVQLVAQLGNVTLEGGRRYL